MTGAQALDLGALCRALRAMGCEAFLRGGDSLSRVDIYIPNADRVADALRALACTTPLTAALAAAAFSLAL